LQICFSVSPIGLGHASRSVAIALELKKLGYRLKFLSGSSAVDFLSSYGFDVISFHEKVPLFKVSKKGVLKNVSRWMINYIRFYRRSKKKAVDFLNEYECDIIISDEDFAFAMAAIERGMKPIFITDLIQTHFAKNWFSKIIEKRTNAWFRWFFNISPITIVPEEEGEKIGNMYFIGPIVRRLSLDPSEVKKRLGIDGKFILVTSGGTPIGDFLFKNTTRLFDEIKREVKEDLSLVLIGKNASKYGSRNNVVAMESYRDLHEVVAASDLVITTAGKSTIDECRVYRTPCIPIPIKGHYEQERNARKMGYTYNDLFRLKELIVEQLKEPRVNAINNNLDSAVKLIIEFIKEEIESH